MNFTFFVRLHSLLLNSIFCVVINKKQCLNEHQHCVLVLDSLNRVSDSFSFTLSISVSIYSLFLSISLLYIFLFVSIFTLSLFLLTYSFLFTMFLCIFSPSLSHSTCRFPFLPLSVLFSSKR